MAHDTTHYSHRTAVLSIIRQDNSGSTFVTTCIIITQLPIENLLYPLTPVLLFESKKIVALLREGSVESDDKRGIIYHIKLVW